MNLSRSQLGWLALAALFVVAAYLLTSAAYYRVGFPLDDSWIHQTYARNLALSGQLAFLPGQPSAGSTSLLWTGLLAIGFLLGLAPHAWAFLLGAICMFGLAVIAEQIVRSLAPSYRAALPLAGLLVVLDWRHAWAAVSGMEILLYTLLVLYLFLLILQGSRRFFAMGLLAGLAVWVRPDGLTLLGPLLFSLWFLPGAVSQKAAWAGQASLGVACLIAPYILLNLALSGSPFPNTFYAKQAEYAAWQARPFYEILAGLGVHLLSGVSMALLPGLAAGWMKPLRERNTALLACLLWMAGYALLYAFRLPMYQHGRYIMPALSALLVLGGAFFFQWMASALPRQRLLRFAWGALAGMLLVVFFVFGALTYAQDVAFIESEMVQTSQWVAENLPAGSIIAVHDIGAIGYANRSYTLVDLAGLVTPEVIPFIRDESRLAAYLDQRNVEFLIIFPNWYPELSKQAELLYITGSPYAPMQGGENLAVYRWQKP